MSTREPHTHGPMCPGVCLRPTLICPDCGRDAHGMNGCTRKKAS